MIQKKLVLGFKMICLLGLLACSESSKNDLSLSMEVSQQDSIEVERLRSKWNKSRYQTPDSMRVAADNMIAFAKESTNKKAEAIGQNMLASYYSKVGSYDVAIALLKENIILAKNDSELLAPTYNNLGNLYIKTGDYEKALDAHLSGLKAVEKGQDRRRKSISLLNIAGIYGHLGENDKSLSLSQEAFDLADENGFLNVKMQSAFQIAELHLGNENDSLALIYADSVISVATKLETDFGINKARSVQSKVYMNQGNLQEALKLIRQSKDYYKKSDNMDQVILQTVTEASVLEKLSEKSAAESLILQLLPVALRKNQKEEIWQLYQLLSLVQEQQGKIEASFKSYKNYKLYQDSVVNIEKNKAIEELAVQYETEKKEAEIASLSQQAAIQQLEIEQKNQTIYFSLLVFLLILGVAYFIYDRQLTSRKRKQIELEQRFLLSQLNPHFISNALVAVQSSLMAKDTESASSYLHTFSRLMREILENSRQEFIPVEDEVSMLEDYLDINQKRLDNIFSYSVIVNGNIDQQLDAIPPMFVQPFVENAIEHGLPKKEGEIKVTFMKNGDFVKIAIEDNGPGLSDKGDTSKKISLSSNIIRERIKLFNQSLKNKIDLLIENRTDEQGNITGTKVQLRVPIQL